MMNETEALALIDEYTHDHSRGDAFIKRLRAALGSDTRVGQVLDILDTTCRHCGTDTTDSRCVCWNDE